MDNEAIRQRCAELALRMPKRRPPGQRDPNSAVAKVRAARALISELRAAHYTWPVIANALELRRFKDGAPMAGDHLAAIVAAIDRADNPDAPLPKKRHRKLKDTSDRESRQDTIEPKQGGQPISNQVKLSAAGKKAGETTAASIQEQREHEQQRLNQVGDEFIRKITGGQK